MAIHKRQLPGIGAGAHGPELVLLPGWGFSTPVWGAEEAEWLGGLCRIGPVTLVELKLSEAVDTPTFWTQLMESFPEQAVWLGWSLGGMLAVELAARYPERCLALVTLASNACFAARPDWPQAMPSATFQQFYNDVQAAPDATWRRFLGLCAQQNPATGNDGWRQDADSLPNLCLRQTETTGGVAASDARTTLRRLRELQPLPRGLAPSARHVAPSAAATSPSDADPLRNDEPATATQAPALRQLLLGLEVLQRLDTRQALAQLHGPTLHLLAAGDALVPPAAACAIAALNPAAQVAILPGGHTLHLSATDAVLEQLRGLLLAHELYQPPRDKQAVARSFSRAATSYDAAAHLQQRVGRQLLQRLSTQPGGRWLDLGCGTGAALPELATRLQPAAGQPAPKPAIVALDLAEGMLRLARQRCHTPPGQSADATEQRLRDTALLASTSYLCADAEQLPLADASIDGVISSLAVQWCDDLTAVCTELARVLRPGGRAWIATLGPDTLASLRRAWAEVDDRVHVNRFATQGEWQAAIAAAGLTLEHRQEQPETLYYSDILTLARELKALGANNRNAGRPTGLTGRQRLAQLRTAYQRYRQPAGLPAEYQVWYLELRRPGPGAATGISAGDRNA